MTRAKADTGRAAKKLPARKVKAIAPIDGAAATATATAKSAREPAHGKAKLVRDSFTIPKDEYLVLAALKARAAHLRRPIKKSELLRAGIAALLAMSDRTFLAALAKVPTLKTGRPKDPAKDGATA